MRTPFMQGGLCTPFGASIGLASGPSFATVLAGKTTLSGALPVAFSDFDQNVYGKPDGLGGDAISGTVSDVIDISRGSAKNILLSSGAYDLVPSGADLARSYHPQSGKTGLLIEDSASNQFANSQIDSGWSTANAVIASDGAGSIPSKNAHTLTAISSSGANKHRISKTFTATAGNNCFWAIVENPQNISHLALRTFGFDQDSGAWFAPSTGVVDRVNNVVDSGIINLGGGYYVIYMVINTTSDISGEAIVYLAEGASNFNITDASGDESVVIHHIQCEAGTYLTSPIVTNGASVVRLVDDVEGSDLLNAAAASMLNDGALTYFWEGSFSPTVVETHSALIGINDGTTDDEIQIRLRADIGAIELIIKVGAATVTAISFADLDLIDPAQTNKIAVRFEENNVAIAVNGAIVNTDTSITLPAVTQVQFGQHLGSKRTAALLTIDDRFYAAALSNADLVGLTS